MRIVADVAPCNRGLANEFMAHVSTEYARLDLQHAELFDSLLSEQIGSLTGIEAVIWRYLWQEE